MTDGGSDPAKADGETLALAREEPDVGTFAGVRLSKGATRAEGMAALKRMLSGGVAPSGPGVRRVPLSPRSRRGFTFREG